VDSDRFFYDPAYNGKALVGVQVPNSPPFGYGYFRPLSEWRLYLKSSALDSALRAEAVRGERQGPRGGRWYAATSVLAWKAWASDYRERSRKRAEGAAANEAQRLLVGFITCTSCEFWRQDIVLNGMWNCTRPGKGPRRSGWRGVKTACSYHREARPDDGS